MFYAIRLNKFKPNSTKALVRPPTLIVVENDNVLMRIYIMIARFESTKNIFSLCHFTVDLIYDDYLLMLFKNSL